MKVPGGHSFIGFTHYGAFVSLQIGWKRPDGGSEIKNIELTQAEASRLSICCSDLVLNGKATVGLFSAGWSVYPTEEIEDAEALWLP